MTRRDSPPGHSRTALPSHRHRTCSSAPRGDVAGCVICSDAGAPSAHAEKDIDQEYVTSDRFFRRRSPHNSCPAASTAQDETHRPTRSRIPIAVGHTVTLTPERRQPRGPRYVIPAFGRRIPISSTWPAGLRRGDVPPRPPGCCRLPLWSCAPVQLTSAFWLSRRSPLATSAPTRSSTIRTRPRPD
jgi:hypothetical protein